MRNVILIVVCLFCFGLTQTIPDNTWVDADLTYNLPSWVNNGGWSTSDGYCGSTFNDKDGTVLWRTGVRDNGSGCHLYPGFYSNAWLEWDPSTNEANVIDVFNYGGGSYDDFCFLPAFANDTTPTPRHVYDGITYTKEQDAIYLMLGAYGRGKPSGGAELDMYNLDEQSTWKFSMAEKKWYRIDDNIRQFWGSVYTVSNYESHLQYWPEGHQLLFVDDRGTHHAVFNLNTEAWSNISASGFSSPFSLYNARSAWDTKRDLWVFRNNSNVCVYDPATRQYTQLPGCGVDNHGIAYNSKHDVYIVTGSTGNQTKVYEIPQSGVIESGSWKTVQGGSVSLPDGYPQYDPATDQVLLVRQHNAFRFRYVPESTAIAPIQLETLPDIKISITPNPFQHGTAIAVQFKVQNAKFKVQICDIAGRQIVNFGLNKRVYWDASGQPAGIYFVRVINDNKIFQKKIFLMR